MCQDFCILMTMNKDDVAKLAGLARLDLSDSELEGYAKDFTTILDYVSHVSEVSGDGTADQGWAINQFRVDAEPHETGKYTSDIIREAPDQKGDYLKVQKILGSSDE